MARQTNTERNTKLRNTPEGAAMLDFLARYSSQAEVNRILELRPNIISQCLMRGQISRPLARQIETKLGIPKEQLRPDLSADEWAMGDPGRVPGQAIERDGEDQKTLLMLADHYGSVAGFAAASGFSVADYHRWMSRNKIPVSAIQRLCMIAPIDIVTRLHARLA